MNTPALPTVIGRSASTIFFDDVRFENTGKLLIVGMYPDMLTVASFPSEVVVQFMVTVVTPADRPFKKLILRAYHDDQLLFADEVPEDRLGVDAGSPVEFGAKSEGVVPIYFVRGFFTSPKLLVNEPGNLRIRVETESEIIPAGALVLQAVQ